MRKTPALTTAQLIEARRLIVRSGRRDASPRDTASRVQSPSEAPDAAPGDRGFRAAPASDPKHARWQPTEWSETAFEPRA